MTGITAAMATPEAKATRQATPQRAAIRAAAPSREAAGPAPAITLPRSLAGLPIQPSRLMVGATSDPAEHDAERVAASFGGTAGGARHGASRAFPAPSIAGRSLSDAGRALDPATRAFFEPRVGRNLGGVRVHDGPIAAAAARAVGAQAYTAGAHIVFGAGRYAPGTDAGRALVGHELAHVLQNTTDAGSGATLRRAPDDAPVAPGTLDIGPSDDLTAKNQKLVDFVATFQRQLAASPKAMLIATAFWNSKPAFDGGQGDKLDALRMAATARAGQVKAALVGLGIPAAAVSDNAADTNEGMVQGPEGVVRLVVLTTPLFPPQPHWIDPATVATPPKAPGAPLLDLDKDADVGGGNPRLAELGKYQLVPQLKDPGGTVNVIAFVADEGAAPVPDTAGTARKRGEDRARAARDSLVAAGVNPAEIYAEARVVPAADPRIGHIWVQFVPKGPKADTGSGLDFDKFTTLQIQTPRLTFTVKIPKSIELKTKYVEGKISIPKGASLTFKPLPGVPGVEIALAGEITSLSSLAGSTTPPTATPGAPAPPAATPPVKFSLSVAINGKGFKVEASTEVNLDNTQGTLHRGTITSGLYLTLIESGVKYQIPSSVLDDLNTNGAKLQKAINQLMGSTNPPAATRAVGDPPPAPDTPQSALSNLSDAADAIGGIADAMDKIDKAKTEKVSPKLKIGVGVVDPIGPPGVGGTTSDRPIVTFGVTGSF